MARLVFVVFIAAALIAGCGGGDKNLAACEAMQRAVDLSDRYVRTPLAERGKFHDGAHDASRALLRKSEKATAPRLADQGARLARLYLRQLEAQPVDSSELATTAAAVNAECQRLGKRITSTNS